MGSGFAGCAFFGVENLSIKDGFPHERGLTILDISKRGLDGLKVLVTDVESSHGELEFWAREVVNLNEAGSVDLDAS
jgi:hypothetical protein